MIKNRKENLKELLPFARSLLPVFLIFTGANFAYFCFCIFAYLCFFVFLRVTCAILLFVPLLACSRG